MLAFASSLSICFIYSLWIYSYTSLLRCLRVTTINIKTLIIKTTKRMMKETRTIENPVPRLVLISEATTWSSISKMRAKQLIMHLLVSSSSKQTLYLSWKIIITMQAVMIRANTAMPVLRIKDMSAHIAINVRYRSMQQLLIIDLRMLLREVLLELLTITKQDTLTKALLYLLWQYIIQNTVDVTTSMPVSIILVTKFTDVVKNTATTNIPLIKNIKDMKASITQVITLSIILNFYQGRSLLTDRFQDYSISIISCLFFRFMQYQFSLYIMTATKRSNSRARLTFKTFTRFASIYRAFRSFWADALIRVGLTPKEYLPVNWNPDQLSTSLVWSRSVKYVSCKTSIHSVPIAPRFLTIVITRKIQYRIIRIKKKYYTFLTKDRSLQLQQVVDRLLQGYQSESCEVGEAQKYFIYCELVEDDGTNWMYFLVRSIVASQSNTMVRTLVEESNVIDLVGIEVQLVPCSNLSFSFKSLVLSYMARYADFSRQVLRLDGLQLRALTQSLSYTELRPGILYISFVQNYIFLVQQQRETLERELLLMQVWSVSTKHREEHPSLFIVFPSSQVSFASIMPFPHVLVPVVFVHDEPVNVVPAIQTHEAD